MQAAGDYLRELPERLMSRGIDDPTIPLWADTIETLTALGELGQAGAYLGHYEAHAERLGNPWPIAAAARCRGLLAAAEGDFARAEAALEDALAELEGAPYPFDRGRALLALGSVRRRAQQKGPAEGGARTRPRRLRRARRRACGPTRLAASCAGSVAGRTPDVQLTDTERQVAALASEGRTNKEIAAALYMGVSTVEAHLSRVYRKLGVRRAELSAWLVASLDS